MKKQILATLFLLTLLASCTVQKRYFNSGFNINWHITGKSQGEEKSLNRREKVQESEQLSSELISMENTVTDGEEILLFEYSANEFDTLTFQKSNSVNLNTNSESRTTKSEDIKTEIQQVKIKQVIKSKSKSNDDTYLYLLFMAMAASSIGGIKGFRKKLTSVTRWAKENPKKTQIAITGMQLSLAGLGLISGYNLSKMGFNFSDNVSFTMTAIGLAGFLATPFLPKKNSLNIPKKILRNKIGYMSIALSAFMLFNITGNKMAQSQSKSLIPNTVENFDKFLFGEENSKSEKSSAINSKRAAAEAGVIVAAVLLIILLLTTLCAGICIALLATGLEMMFLGLIIAGLSVFGIVETVNWVSRSSKKNTVNTKE